jgi:hypothetical protein
MKNSGFWHISGFYTGNFSVFWFFLKFCSKTLKNYAIFPLFSPIVLFHICGKNQIGEFKLCKGESGYEKAAFFFIN